MKKKTTRKRVTRRHFKFFKHCCDRIVDNISYINKRLDWVKSSGNKGAEEVNIWNIRRQNLLDITQWRKRDSIMGKSIIVKDLRKRVDAIRYGNQLEEEVGKCVAAGIALFDSLMEHIDTAGSVDISDINMVIEWCRKLSRVLVELKEVKMKQVLTAADVALVIAQISQLTEYVEKGKRIEFVRRLRELLRLYGGVEGSDSGSDSGSDGDRRRLVGRRSDISRRIEEISEVGDKMIEAELGEDVLVEVKRADEARDALDVLPSVPEYKSLFDVTRVIRKVVGIEDIDYNDVLMAADMKGIKYEVDSTDNVDSGIEQSEGVKEINPYDYRFPYSRSIISILAEGVKEVVSAGKRDEMLDELFS